MQNLQTDNKPIYDNVVYSFPVDWPSEDFEKVLIKNLPSYRKFKRKEISSSGRIPVIDQGSEAVAGYINDEASKYSGDLPIIIFGDHTRNVKYIDFDFAVGADGTKLLKPKEELLEKFFYYYLRSVFVPPSGYSRHYKYLKEIKVPVPEKSIQQDVVSTLDKLLPQAQAQTRKINKAKQYVMKFRQTILSAAITGKLTEGWRTKNNATNALPKQFPKIKFESTELENWVQTKVKNVYQSFGGGTPSRGVPEYWGGDVSWVSSGDVKQELISTGSEFITEAGLENSSSKLCVPGSVIVVVRSGILRHTLPVAIVQKTLAINQDIKCFDCGNEQLNHWLSLFLRGNEKNILLLNREGTTVQSVKYDTLKDLDITFPPKEEQEEIVKQVKRYFDITNQVEKQIEKAEARVSKLTQAILAKTFNKND